MYGLSLSINEFKGSKAMSQNVNQEGQTESGLQSEKKQEKTHSRKRESWLSQNIAPMLALVAVIGTFWMFQYFIKTASTPVSGNESAEISLLEQKIKNAELKKRPDEEIQKFKDLLVNAKSNQEVSRAQRSMVKDFILYILGVLSSLITTIYGYYFGSSRGSASKDDTMKQMARFTQGAESASV